MCVRSLLVYVFVSVRACVCLRVSFVCIVLVGLLLIWVDWLDVCLYRFVRVLLCWSWMRFFACLLVLWFAALLL